MKKFMVVLVVSFQHNYRKERRAESFSLREKKRDIGARLDGRLHTDAFPLHAKTLAALSTTCGKDSAATLGCHAGTEAMSLCALASVRLIGALHY